MVFITASHHLFPRPPGMPINVTLSIVREQGSSGEVAVHYQTRAALSQPPSNQATAGQDYISKDETVIMIDSATVVLVTVTILPVRMVCRMVGKLVLIYQYEILKGLLVCLWFTDSADKDIGCACTLIAFEAGSKHNH